jgi:hypothetical protein
MLDPSRTMALIGEQADGRTAGAAEKPQETFQQPLHRLCLRGANQKQAVTTLVLLAVESSTTRTSSAHPK